MRTAIVFIALSMLFGLGCAGHHHHHRHWRCGECYVPCEDDPTGTASRRRVCDMIFNAVEYIDRSLRIGRCLPGGDCDEDEEIRKLCSARDNLVKAYEWLDCTDKMLPPRPEICPTIVP